MAKRLRNHVKSKDGKELFLSDAELKTSQRLGMQLTLVNAAWEEKADTPAVTENEQPK